MTAIGIFFSSKLSLFLAQFCGFLQGAHCAPAFESANGDQASG